MAAVPNAVVNASPNDNPLNKPSNNKPILVLTVETAFESPPTIAAPIPDLLPKSIPNLAANAPPSFREIFPAITVSNPVNFITANPATMVADNGSSSNQPFKASFKAPPIASARSSKSHATCPQSISEKNVPIESPTFSQSTPSMAVVRKVSIP